ncbi:MAG: hypothetical protein RLZZ399_2036 [Verrucomicrobiota bacterium]|jgi:hypothetical protein
MTLGSSDAAFFAKIKRSSSVFGISGAAGAGFSFGSDFFADLESPFPKALPSDFVSVRDSLFASVEEDPWDPPFFEADPESEGFPKIRPKKFPDLADSPSSESPEVVRADLELLAVWEGESAACEQESEQRRARAHGRVRRIKKGGFNLDRVRLAVEAQGRGPQEPAARSAPHRAGSKEVGRSVS